MIVNRLYMCDTVRIPTCMTCKHAYTELYYTDIIQLYKIYILYRYLHGDHPSNKLHHAHGVYMHDGASVYVQCVCHNCIYDGPECGRPGIYDTSYNIKNIPHNTTTKVLLCGSPQ